MATTIGICHLTLRLPENGSLKGKRMVLKSVQQRLHNKFNVSVAEGEHNDTWQLAAAAGRVRQRLAEPFRLLSVVLRDYVPAERENDERLLLTRAIRVQAVWSD